MPLLAGFIGSIFTTMFGFFAAHFAHRVAIAAATVATMLALMVTLGSAMAIAVQGLFALLAPPAGIETAIWLVVSPQTLAAATACITVDGLVSVYRANLWALNIAARA